MVSIIIIHYSHIIIIITIVGEVKLNLPAMMKQKEDAVTQLTSGIAYLFKNNKV